MNLKPIMTTHENQNQIGQEVLDQVVFLLLTSINNTEFNLPTGECKSPGFNIFFVPTCGKVNCLLNARIQTSLSHCRWWLLE